MKLLKNKTINIFHYVLFLLMGIFGFLGNGCEASFVRIKNIPGFFTIVDDITCNDYEFSFRGLNSHGELGAYPAIRLDIELYYLGFVGFSRRGYIKARSTRFGDYNYEPDPETGLETWFFNGSAYWDGIFDTYLHENPYPEAGNLLIIKIGFADPVTKEYYSPCYPNLYLLGISDEGVPRESKIDIQKITINDEMKNTLSWDELYNANTNKIKVHYYYFKNPNEPHCDEIHMQITQVNNTVDKYHAILNTSPIENDEKPETAEWNGKLINENNEPVSPNPKGTPKLKFKIGFVDENDPDLWTGVDEDPIDITGVSFIPPEISFSYGTVNPLYFDFDANQGDFLVNIFVNAPVDVNSKIWFEFGPGGKYKSNEVVTTNYITYGQFYNVPIVWGGYTNSLLNDCSGSTTLKVYLEYTKTYPIDEPQEIEIPLNVQGGNSYPTDVTVEVDQYQGVNASAIIKEDLVNNAFGPAGRRLIFNYHETVYDFIYEEVQRPDENEDWDPGQVPEDEAVAVIQEYKNMGKDMYIFYTKKLYVINKNQDKTYYGGVYITPPINGSIVTLGTTCVIHELGHHITQGGLKDHTNNHYHDGVWDSGCVMPYQVHGVGVNTSFNRDINPHFCLKCMSTIRSNLKY